MKKTLRVAGGALLIAASGFILIVTSRPGSTVVRRSVVIEATPEEVFGYVSNLDRRSAWSPWQAADGVTTAPCSEARSGEGACAEWTGAGLGGHGKVTVLSVDPTKGQIERLELFEPFTAAGRSTFEVEPTGEGASSTKLTWTYTQQNDFRAKFAGLYIDLEAKFGMDFDHGLATLKPLVEVYHGIHLRELEEARRLAEEQALIQEDVAWFVAEAGACVLWRTRPGAGADPVEVLRFPGRCPAGNSVAWNTWKDRFVFWDTTEAWVGDLHIHAAYPVPIPSAPLDAMWWRETNLVATAQTAAERVDGQWVYEGVREATVAGHNAVVCLTWNFTGNPGAPGAKAGVDPALWTPDPPRILSYAGDTPTTCAGQGDDGAARAYSWKIVEGRWEHTEGLPDATPMRVYARQGFEVFCAADHAWAVAPGTGRLLWEGGTCPIRWEAEP
ncbi:hypothetical protein LBMAG42_06890 [Deltaproteobacteria bacterium]|nr:hypothetical protein LBMAG42_06890 [Deltaproteobacteria bacterium]